MRFNRNKWLAYTVLVGLIPALTRVLIWVVTSEGAIAPFVASDFVAFGLVLHISIINEIEYLPARDQGWKSIQNGASITFIALYSALYGLIIIGESAPKLLDSRALLICSIAFAAVSSLLSISVFQRLTR